MNISVHPACKYHNSISVNMRKTDTIEVDCESILLGILIERNIMSHCTDTLYTCRRSELDIFPMPSVKQ